ncbi:hypothetical protein BGZ76_010576 [Entomortierella beljakovae]|nr:hypothetical protein BGZ76_010576 [Entomortierella beljakovae]
MSRSSTIPSTSPSPLPSPTPSATMSPDWHLPSNRHLHTLPHHSNYHHHHHHQQHQQQHDSQLDLLSPSSSEADLGSDVKTLPPLFPANSPPLFSSEFQHSSHLSPQPTQGTFGSSYVSNSFSRSSNPPSGVRNPSLDLRAPSPLSNLPWKSHQPHQPHQKLPPIRAPERAGQDVIRTSSLDTTSSEYLNMDYYSIYRKNPRLLRPEGGRFDEKRHHVRTHSDDVALVGESSHPMTHAPSKNKPRSRVSAHSSMDSNGMSRRQSMPLISTGTSRVLRHEDARMDATGKHVHDADHDIVRSLGIHSAATSSRYNATPSARPAAMSIHHLLSDTYTDMAQSSSGLYHRDSSSFSNDSDTGSESSMKRKKSQSIMGDEMDGEPKKRRRMSKKRAAELGLLDSDGNVIKKRKRTKKVHDPDHVSPSGFRHGGERTVQEPEEVVHPSPDVGPISMLDVKQPPMVIWKGQPLSVAGKPGYELLHPHEARIASTLRLSPAQYLNCKQTLILASRSYFSNPDGKQFRKSDAQKLCRIDVNKTSRLWEVFAKIGWLAGITERDI